MSSSHLSHPGQAASFQGVRLCPTFKALSLGVLPKKPPDLVSCCRSLLYLLLCSCAQASTVMACICLSHPMALPGDGHHYVHARTRQMPKSPSATLETQMLAFCCHSASTGKVKAGRDQPARCPRRGCEPTSSPSLQPQASDDDELRGSESLQHQLWLVFVQ